MDFDVVCVGSAGFDIFVSGRDFRAGQVSHDSAISLDADNSYKIDHAVYEVGGSGLNAAITFARQDIKVGCIAKTGRDHLGNQIKTIAKYEQIEPSLIISNPEHHSDMDFHIVTGRSHEILLSHRNSFTSMRNKDIHFPGLQTKLLYLAELPVDFKLYKFFATWARANDVQLVVNLKSFYDYSQKQINFVFSTAKRIMTSIALANSFFQETSHPIEVIRQLNAFGASSIVLYDINHEAYAYEDKTVYRCGAYKKVIPLDMTGCDDVFCAGYLSALSQQKDIPKALTVASAMASSVSEVFGIRAGILKKPVLRTMNIQTEVL